MSPITHGLIGWLIAQPLPARRDRVLVTAAAVVADLDGLSILWSLDAYDRLHHTFGHNLFAGLAVTLACLALARARPRAAALAAASYHSHILGDLLGSGAGWPILYFWPLSDSPFSFAPPLQWELGSWQNVAVTAACLTWAAAIGVRQGRTVVEVASAAADAEVVAVLRRWAGVRTP
jgi:inner membrane protein